MNSDRIREWDRLPPEFRPFDSFQDTATVNNVSRYTFDRLCERAARRKIEKLVVDYWIAPSTKIEKLRRLLEVPTVEVAELTQGVSAAALPGVLAAVTNLPALKYVTLCLVEDVTSVGLDALHSYLNDVAATANVTISMARIVENEDDEIDVIPVVVFDTGVWKRQRDCVLALGQKCMRDYVPNDPLHIVAAMLLGDGSVSRFTP